MGKNAGKGVFITTTTFTKEAKEYAKNQSVALIDGDQLLDLLWETNTGLQTSFTYEMKKIDLDYFEEM